MTSIRAETIDVEELASWIVGKVESAHGVRATNRDDLRLLHEAAIEAVNRDSPDVHVTLTLDVDGKHIIIDETLTRTAARTLFAPVAGKVAAARERERQLALAKSAAKPPEPAAQGSWSDLYAACFGFPYIGQFVLVVLLAISLIALLSRQSHHAGARHDNSETR